MTTKLEQLSNEIRKGVLEMIFEAKASHIGGALSMVEILTVLYFDMMKIDPENPDWNERDIFLLSKGHACSSLYVTLAKRGFFPLEDLKNYGKNESIYLSHASHYVPGVELSSGSLGHALSVGCGIALAKKRKGETNKIYVLLSDGELDEGSNWEAILFANQHKLNNMTVIVDYNKIQSLGNVKDVINLSPLDKKFGSFGWNVKVVDGHNHAELIDAFNQDSNAEKPKVIIANTVKGKGIDFMENKLLWHYRTPSKEEYQNAMDQLEGNLCVHHS